MKKKYSKKKNSRNRLKNCSRIHSRKSLKNCSRIRSRKSSFGQFDDDFSDLELRLGRIKYDYPTEYDLENRFNDIMEKDLPKIIDEKSWTNVYSGLNQMERQIDFLNNHFRQLKQKLNSMEHCLTDFDVFTDPSEVEDLPIIGDSSSKINLEKVMMSPECYYSLNESNDIIKSIQQISAMLQVLCTRYIQKYNKIQKIFKPFKKEIDPNVILTRIG